jgi:hypothetical protein
MPWPNSLPSCTKSMWWGKSPPGFSPHKVHFWADLWVHQDLLCNGWGGGVSDTDQDAKGRLAVALLASSQPSLEEQPNNVHHHTYSPCGAGLNIRGTVWSLGSSSWASARQLFVLTSVTSPLLFPLILEVTSESSSIANFTAWDITICLLRSEHRPLEPSRICRSNPDLASTISQLRNSSSRLQSTKAWAENSRKNSGNGQLWVSNRISVGRSSSYISL